MTGVMSRTETLTITLLTGLAEHVMGWKILAHNDRIPDDYSRDSRINYVRAGEHAGDVRWISPENCSTNYWNPFVSIEDAFMIVRKLHDDGLVLHLTAADGVSLAAFIPVTDVGSIEPHVYSTADGRYATPEAICLAAVAALERRKAGGK